MNHIEEMMRVAEVDDTIQKFNVIKRKWVVVGHQYPDFTAEKQLELIQLIASERGLLMKENALTVLNLKREKDIELCVEGCFVQGLAALVSNLMKAGELDKTKVKEILEG